MDVETPEYVLYDVPTGEELGRGHNPHLLVSLAEEMNVTYWGLCNANLDEIMFGAETVAGPAEVVSV